MTGGEVYSALSGPMDWILRDIKTRLLGKKLKRL